MLGIMLSKIKLTEKLTFKNGFKFLQENYLEIHTIKSC